MGANNLLARKAQVRGDRRAGDGDQPESICQVKRGRAFPSPGDSCFQVGEPWVFPNLQDFRETLTIVI